MGLRRSEWAEKILSYLLLIRNNKRVNFDRKKFESELPPFFHPLLDELFKFGFVPTLVGGAVRDFYLQGDLGNDWDLELSHETIAFNKNEWKNLGKTLSRFGKLTFLPYEIIRVEANSFTIEFSPPRIEVYKENAIDHSNFDAHFDFKLPFSEAVKRRDFTINALGIRFKTKKDYEFLDPTGGLVHLRDKVLHFAGPDFGKDPVRFLRAQRFAQKLNFTFSKELEKVLSDMELGGITPSYVWSEMQKSADPVTYLEKLIKEQKTHSDLKLPVDDSLFSKSEQLRKVLRNSKRHETWIIALEWVGVPAENWSKYFSLSSDTCRRLARWAHSSKSFQSILPETFHGEFDEVRGGENFEKIFDWYFTTKQLLQKNPELPLLQMIEEYLPHWIHLYRFEPVKDVKHIDPPFRAKYQVWNLCQRL